MKSEMVSLIAQLMGDGCVSKKYFGYFNKNDFLIEKFENNVRTTFGNSIHFTKGTKDNGVKYSMVNNKKIINQLLEISRSYKSGDIELPSVILNGNNEAKSIFLLTLFDDEGSVGLRIFKKTGETKRDIHIALKSLKMIEQIKSILENDFQIKCNKIHPDVRRRNGKEFITWCLAVTGKDNLEKFNSLIGFDHPEKKEKLQVLLKSYIRKV